MMLCVCVVWQGPSEDLTCEMLYAVPFHGLSLTRAYQYLHSYWLTKEEHQTPSLTVGG